MMPLIHTTRLVTTRAITKVVSLTLHKIIHKTIALNREIRSDSCLANQALMSSFWA